VLFATNNSTIIKRVYHFLVVLNLDRKEAVNLIKDITEEKCTNLTGHDIILKLTNAKKNTQDYELHIKTKIDKVSFRCLEIIVENNGYALKSNTDKGLIVISGQRRVFEETGII
jgi:hypothetical protein